MTCLLVHGKVNNQVEKLLEYIITDAVASAKIILFGVLLL